MQMPSTDSGKSDAGLCSFGPQENRHVRTEGDLGQGQPRASRPDGDEWLATQAANSAAATDVPDNAPQNIYATVKVNGKVVATLYNGGSSVMTNAAAATVGDLQDPPGLNGGPDLAQSRAERIAKAVGGTIEKASTAITQSAWRPRQSVSPTYSRAQLDAAFQAMMAEGQKAIAQRQGGIPPAAIRISAPEDRYPAPIP